METILFAGVCGRALGTVAMDLAETGIRVLGFDRAFYPPVSDRLDASKVVVLEEEEALVNLDEVDLVIAGAMMGRGTKVVESALDRRIPVLSLPRFLEERFLRKSRNIVVAGTNGKTTTTAMITHILNEAGIQPDYLVGGECDSVGAPARFRGAEWSVLEGDEFVAGFGDRNPKFLYYRPEILVVTNLSFDHPEVYRDEREYRQAFAYLVQQVPRNGVIILGADKKLDFLAERAACEVKRIDTKSNKVELSIPGRFNVTNAAAAMMVAESCEIDSGLAAKALLGFSGVKGRFEMMHDQDGLTVIVDDGYHATAIEEVLSEIADAAGGKEIVVAYVPRFTGGSDQSQQENLPTAMARANKVVWSRPLNYRVFSEAPFDLGRFSRDLLERDVESHAVEAIKEIPGEVREVLSKPSVVLLSIGPGPHRMEEWVKTIAE
ncbi:MAG: Mur ligase family protein [Verrucomicrobiota bacterium]